MKTKKSPRGRLPYGKVNVRLFQRIKRAILAEPLRLNMRSWIDWVGNPYSGLLSLRSKRQSPTCGTVACIAGWACLLSELGHLPKSPNETRATRTAASINQRISEEAAKLLQLSEETCKQTFTEDLWPDPFRSQFERAATPKQRAKVAAAYIDWICGKSDVWTEFDDDLEVKEQLTNG